MGSKTPEPSGTATLGCVPLVIAFFVLFWFFKPSDEEHAAFQQEVAAYQAQQQKDIIHAQLSCDLGSRSACERYGNLTR